MTDPPKEPPRTSYPIVAGGSYIEGQSKPVEQTVQGDTDTPAPAEVATEAQVEVPSTE